MANRTPKKLERVSELWFEDADVVFQAGQKLFRVHRGILSARSPIFKDLFSLPRSGDPVDEVYQGCPLIHLPDREIDVHHFFKAIFDASSFEGPPAVITVVELLSIFRLSHKYDVTFLKRRSIARLNNLFPTEFQEEEQPMQERLRKCHLKHSTGPPITMDYGLEFLTAAQRCDTPWLIPAAMVASMQRPLTVLFTTQTWRDMSEPLRESYLISRESFEKSRRASTAWMLVVPVEGCETVRRCNLSSQELVRQMLGATTHTSPLLVDERTDLCGKCRVACGRQRTCLRRTLWDALPALNGLPDWTVLKQEKAKCFLSMRASTQV